MPDYAGRVVATQAEMARQGVDALFLSPSPDLAYLTGFRIVPFSSARMYDEMWLPESWLFGAWIFQEGDPIFSVPGRYYNTVGDWRPASLAGDALTILSNSWDDDESDDNDDSTSGEDATDTTIQAAILAGHTATPSYGSSNPGGQFENFPRFLEDWGSAEAEIVGSFISLWESQIADSDWDCCNFYGPPTRDWRFDSRFEDPENFPPGTPVVGQILRIGFVRTY